MKLIKLDAIDSTNDFLKRLSGQQYVENFTVITAENQTKGKGQMGSEWVSEIGKNLIMSILVKDFLTENYQIFNLNIVVSMAVIQALDELKIPKLSVKWPNDIMSDNKKIGGILIENSLKSDGTITSVVGLGLNVNQTNFVQLPKGSSLALVCNTTFDKEEILLLVVKHIKNNIEVWSEKATEFWSNYMNSLFKKDIPMPFQDKHDKNFMGIVKGVSDEGKLQIQLEDDSIGTFDIKEIQMLF